MIALVNRSGLDVLPFDEPKAPAREGAIGTLDREARDENAERQLVLRLDAPSGGAIEQLREKPLGVEGSGLEEQSIRQLPIDGHSRVRLIGLDEGEVCLPLEHVVARSAQSVKSPELVEVERALLKAEPVRVSSEQQVLREILDAFRSWFWLPVYQRQLLERELAQKKTPVLQYLQELLARKGAY